MLNNENTWTQGREHHILGSVEGAKGGTAVDGGGRGEITWGEMPDVGDEGTEAANHIATCVPMQQSCMICTCTPEPKVQLKKTVITGGAIIGYECIRIILFKINTL